MTDGHECDAQWTPDYEDVYAYIRECERRHAVHTTILILVNLLVMAGILGLAAYLLLK